MITHRLPRLLRLPPRIPAKKEAKAARLPTGKAANLASLWSVGRFAEIVAAVQDLADADLTDDAVQRFALACDRLDRPDLLALEVRRLLSRAEKPPQRLQAVYQPLARAYSSHAIRRLLGPLPEAMQVFLPLCDASFALIPPRPSRRALARACRILADAPPQDQVDLNAARYFAGMPGAGTLTDLRRRLYTAEPAAIAEGSVDVLLLTAADPGYFFSLAPLYLDSLLAVAVESRYRHGVLFLLCDFTPEDRARAETLLATYRGRLPIHLMALTRHPETDASFYCIARYYALAEAVRLTEGRVTTALLATDIDNLFRAPLDAIAEAAGDTPLCHVSAKSYLFPWQRYRANLLALSMAPRHRLWRDRIVALFEERLTVAAEARNFWFLDQGAIARTAIAVAQESRGRALRDITPLYAKACFQPTGGVTATAWGDGRVASDAEAKRDRMQAELAKRAESPS